jgi:Holliday junction resolvasome RuvABC endonuclease subunit
MDPGFASFGVGVVQLFPDHEKVVEVDVIRTKASSKKCNVRSTNDNFRRAEEIATQLRRFIKVYRPKVFTAEALSLPRNASTSSKLSISWGILACFTTGWSIPMLQSTPQELKMMLCNDKSASKLDIQRALERRYPGQFDTFKYKFPPKNPTKPNGQWEHGFDAVGSIVSCLDTEVMRMARGLT